MSRKRAAAAGPSRNQDQKGQSQTGLLRVRINSTQQSIELYQTVRTL